MKKVVIVGPGGLGGTIAALLARKGECDVTIVGRPGAHIDAIQRQHALHLTGLQEFTIQIDATDDPKGIRECDILIYTVKAQDTQAALAITEHIEVRDFATSLQNGVVKDKLLVDVFGGEKVVGGLAVVAGERPTPGVVNWTYDGGTQFGELDGGASGRVDEIVNLFERAGLITQASDAILSATWSKMVGWIPIGLLATLSRRNNAGVMSNRQLVTEYTGMVRELQALAAAKEIPLIDLGPYHVKTWCEGHRRRSDRKGFDIALGWQPINAFRPPRYTERHTHRISGVRRSYTRRGTGTLNLHATSADNVRHTYGVRGYPEAWVKSVWGVSK